MPAERPAVTGQIVVVDYDPEWPEWFERLRPHVWAEKGLPPASYWLPDLCSSFIG